MLSLHNYWCLHKIFWSIPSYVQIWCHNIWSTKCRRRKTNFEVKRTLSGLFIFRAFRGKHITLVVRFPNQGRQVEDLDIWSHTNDTIGQVRRCILNRIKANSAHTKVELFIGGELVDPADDRKLIGQLNLKDKTVSVASWYLCKLRYCLSFLNTYKVPWTESLILVK